MNFHDLVRELNKNVGATVVQTMAGVKTPTSRYKWAKSDGPVPEAEVEARLRLGYRVWKTLASAEGRNVALPWLMGSAAKDHAEAKPVERGLEDKVDEILALTRQISNSPSQVGSRPRQISILGIEGAWDEDDNELLLERSHRQLRRRQKLQGLANTGEPIRGYRYGSQGGAHWTGEVVRFTGTPDNPHEFFVRVGGKEEVESATPDSFIFDYLSRYEPQGAKRTFDQIRWWWASPPLK